MSYIDRVKRFASPEMISKTANYIREHKQWLKPRKLEDLYFDYAPAVMSSVLTAVLLDCGIKPLSLMEFVPEYYGSQLFEGDLIIPNNIKHISDNAFHESYISRAVIGDSVTTIGDSAFGCCYDLKEVTLPKSIVGISPYAFAACESLDTIKYKGTIKDFEALNIDRQSVFFDVYNDIKVICSDGEISI